MAMATIGLYVQMLYTETCLKQTFMELFTNKDLLPAPYVRVGITENVWFRHLFGLHGLVDAKIDVQFARVK